MSKPQPKRVEADEPKAESGPLKKAFSIERGHHGWVMVEYHLRDDQVVEVIRKEPDLKFTAINEFKKAAFHWWDSIG